MAVPERGGETAVQLDERWRIAAENFERFPQRPVEKFHRVRMTMTPFDLDLPRFAQHPRAGEPYPVRTGGQDHWLRRRDRETRKHQLVALDEHDVAPARFGEMVENACAHDAAAGARDAAHATGTAMETAGKEIQKRIAGITTSRTRSIRMPETGSRL